MSPHEVKIALDRKLLSLAREGRVPVIPSIHSVALEDGIVYCMYDIEPRTEDDPLLFEFERPELVSSDDIRDFAAWLAWSDVDVERTVH
jgi:hypothetical protein